jgi:hypothetical protein
MFISDPRVSLQGSCFDCLNVDLESQNLSTIRVTLCGVQMGFTLRAPGLSQFLVKNILIVVNTQKHWSIPHCKSLVTV